MATPSSSFSFQDKVVIVTGGNSGIGLATVHEFLKAGAKVAVFDIRPLVDAKPDERRLDITCDVGVEQAAEAAIAQVVEKWGTIDVLCNVAGVMDGLSRVSETETVIWDRCFKVNVTGPFFLMRACSKLFLSKPKTDPTTTRGSIVNVCSVASTSGAKAGAAYTASKHAILGLTRSTAYMYAREGIRCNAVLPGGVLTNIVANSYLDWNEFKDAPGNVTLQPVQAMQIGLIEAADIARAIAFAAATEGMNGAELVVDKGWSTI